MSNVTVLRNTKMNGFQRKIATDLRRQEIDRSTIWLHAAYSKVFPKWYMVVNLFLYKRGFRRLCNLLTPLFGVRTVYKSSIPIKIEVWKWGKLVEKNYDIQNITDLHYMRTPMVSNENTVFDATGRLPSKAISDEAEKEFRKGF